MPQIPQLRTQGPSPRGAVQLASPSAARRPGEAIAEAGRGLGNLAQGVSQYLQEKQKIDNRAIDDRARNAANQFKDESIAFALTNPDAAPDGSSFVDDGLKDFNSRSKEFFDNLDEDEKARARGQFDGAAAAMSGTLTLKSVAQHAAFATDEADKEGDNSARNVYNQPLNFDFEFAESDGSVEDRRMLYGAKIEAFKKQRKVKLSTSYVNGFLDPEKNDFKGARAALKDPRVQESLSGKQIQSLSLNIEKAKFVALNRKYQEDDRRRLKLKEDKRIRWEDNEIKLLERLDEAKTDEEEDAIISDAQNLRNEGSLSPKTPVNLEKRLEDTDAQQSDVLRGTFDDQISAGLRPLAEVREDVSRAGMSGELTPGDTRALLTTIHNRQRAEDSPDTRRNIKEADRLLRASFEADGFLNGSPFFKQNKRAEMARAQRIANDFQKQGNDPITAMTKAITLVKGDFSAAPEVPFVKSQPKTLPEVNELKTKVEQRRRKLKSTGRLTPEEADLLRTQLIALEDRLRVINIIELKKARGL